MKQPKSYTHPRRDPTETALIVLFAIALAACAVWAVTSFAVARPDVRQDKPVPIVATAIPVTALSYDGGTAAAPVIEAVVANPELVEAEPVETLTYIGKMQIYGYNFNDAKQCGKTVANGITASGEQAIHGQTCAMSKDIPFGTVIYIDGLGYFTVNDRGVGRNTVDIAFNNNADCYAVTGKYDVYLVEREEGMSK